MNANALEIVSSCMKTLQVQSIVVENEERDEKLFAQGYAAGFLLEWSKM